jgi:hypothetical protein
MIILFQIKLAQPVPNVCNFLELRMKCKNYTHHHVHSASRHNWFQSLDAIHHLKEYLGVSLKKNE